MLEGLEVTIINKSDVLAGAETLRFDSEYYLKKYIHAELLIKKNAPNFLKFSELNLIVDGSAFYPALEPYYDTGSYPFIRVGDVKKYVDFENCVKVPFDILHNYPTLKHVTKGDIVLTKGGTIGLAGLITQNCCVTRDLIFINSSVLDENDYVVLFLFLSTDFAYRQLIRSGSQSVQPHLTITLVRNIDVYCYTDFFKEYVVRIYKTSISKLELSKSCYARAETLLLATLGIADFSPSTEAVNIKSFKDSFAATGRLDAESYQPKYDQLRDVLVSYSGGVTTIGSLAGQIANGAEVREYQDEGVAYLRVGDVKNLTIDPSSVVRIDPASAEKGLDKIDLQAGDVLVSRSGSLAITAVVEPEWADALISSHLIRLRITDKRIDPYYLALFLGALPGKMQIQQRSNGGVQPEINQPALKSILVPIPPQSAQQEIRRLILAARNLRDSSNELLEAAKRAVEIAIELDEAAALAYINTHASNHLNQLPSPPPFRRKSDVASGGGR